MAATPARRRCVRRLRQLHDSLASAAADGYDGPLPPPGTEGQRGSSSALSEGEFPFKDSRLLGGGILRVPTGSVPPDPYAKGGVEPTSDYPPFTKKLQVCGITYVARDDVSDGFMLAQADAIAEMLDPSAPGIDTELQAEVVANMHRYRTFIPLWREANAGTRPEEISVPGNGWEEVSPATPTALQLAISAN